MNIPDLLNQIHELEDKMLGCWRKPEKCHGDILAELADKYSMNCKQCYHSDKVFQ